MNIVDIIIIIFILLMGITGFKRGVLKEIVSFIGTILMFILAYRLKNVLGNVLLLNLPMFDFPGVFKGIITLNILLYQGLAFVVILAVLIIIFEMILSITGLIEKLLKFTIVLGIPSKILGFIVGLFEGYVIAFVLLFFLTQPAFNFQRFQKSKFANTMLTSTPILTNVTNDTVQVFNKIYSLTNETDSDILNGKILDMMLDKKIVNYSTVNEMYEKRQINFEGIDDVLNKYKK